MPSPLSDADFFEARRIYRATIMMMLRRSYLALLPCVCICFSAVVIFQFGCPAIVSHRRENRRDV